MECSRISTESPPSIAITLLNDMDFPSVITLASNYVTHLFSKSLNERLVFHNPYHTGNVVIAAKEIGVNAGLTPTELDLTTLAAWFHDVGYIEKYIGHEDVSIAIARDFFVDCNLKRDQINQICNCIDATRFPQSPRNLMEEVLCDADFYHLSRTDYHAYEQALRLEWQTCLDLVYKDREWSMMNLEMLGSHEYFTDYGKTVLKQRKQVNIDSIKMALT